ncbi:MAG: hypothetical protein QOK39_2447 [Acidimicrobiaceae bacterium]|jgi:hypothetical protein|nr:hypothetical protein [Acidimicrobiaceae bacterium]
MVVTVCSLGVVLWGFSTVTGAGPGGGQGSTATVAPPSPVGPVGFALRYLSAYLAAGRGTEQTLAAFVSTPVDLGNVQPGTFQVAASEAIDAATVGAGYWRVTIAAQVLGAPHTDGGNATTIGSTTTVPASAYQPLGERCYLVAVETRGDGFVAPVVPSQIGCPTAARAAPSVFGQAGVPTPDDPATVAVTQFLAVMLTGPADTMGRYLAPGAAVAAITPPPFTTVTVTGVSKAQSGSVNGVSQVLVFAGVEAKDGTGRVTELGYTVQLVKPLNQWLVLKIYGAPPLSH